MIVTEIDPINALQAAMEGYQVTTLDEVVGTADIFVTATGNTDIITADDMAQMKHNAIVCNIGHFDNEIDMAGLARSGATKMEIKPQVDLWTFPDGHSIIVLAEGRLREPRLRHRPPELRDELLVLQPGAGPDGAVHEDRRLPVGVYVLPKQLDEKVARAHLDALGREAHPADRRAGRVPGRRPRRPLQGRALPLLTSGSVVGRRPHAGTCDVQLRATVAPDRLTTPLR